MGNSIEGFNFTVEEATNTSNAQMVDLEQALELSESFEYSFENFDGESTFSGKMANFYGDSDVWEYNSYSQIVDNQNILDIVRRDSNSMIIFDNHTDDLISEQARSQLINKIFLTHKSIRGKDNSVHLERVQIKPNKNHPDFKTGGSFDFNKWYNYVWNLDKKSYISYNFQQSVPYNRDEYKDKNVDSPDFVDIISEYNFYDKKIENIQNENKIPNLYSLLNVRKDSNKNNNRDFHIELSEEVDKIEKEGTSKQVINKYVFTRDEYRSFLKDSEKYSRAYPMQNKIVISSNYEMSLQRVFDSVDLSQYISQNYNLISDDYSMPMFKFTLEENYLFSTSTKKEYEKINAKVVPLFNVINNIEEKDDEIFFGEKKDINSIKEVLKRIILSKTDVEYTKHKRTLKEIYAGKPCQSEILVYRIKKYNKITNEKISDVYLPNLSKEELSYVDTQVKYNVDYRYDIMAYVLIYATCYTCNLNSNTKIERDNAEIEFLLEPSYLVAEVPYYSEECFIMDLPPVYPFADFYSYKNVDDKILINIQQNSGNYEKYPDFFNQNDFERYDRVRKFLKRGFQDKIIYKSDDLIDKIMIFRTDVAPKKYSDFSTLVSFETKNATSFIDTIEPNKKYYYLIRSIDVHNNLSDFSPIYEICLKKINNSVFLEVRNYNIGEERNNEQKTFRRYLYIDGNITQTMLNFDQTGLKYKSVTGEETDGKTAKELDSVPVYGKNDSIFDEGRKIIIRAKSVNSGKSFDISLNFDTKHIK